MSAPASDAPDAGVERRTVVALGRRWSLEVRGAGPVLLLVHGTGASAHSWRDVAPTLAAHCTVVVPDLPGHGGSDAPDDEARLALAPMAEDLAEMLRAEGIAPAFAAGHSAGVAVLLEMALRRRAPLRGVVGFGAALVPPPLAYEVALAPWINRIATTRAFVRAAAFAARRPRVVDSLLRSTGSALPSASVEAYRAAASSSAHVRATLAMMAQWDLRPLVSQFGALRVPVDLFTGDRDEWTPASRLRPLAARLPAGTLTVVPGAGHVLHEERPAFAAAVVLAAARRAGVLASGDAAAPAT